MRDLIYALLLLSVLIWAFSSTPMEEQSEKKNMGMYLSIDGESPTEGTPQPTEGNKMPMPSLETEKQSLEMKPSDKRPETSDPAAPKPDKTIDELAWEVIIGLWDCTETRWQMLTEAGYDAQAVQQRVNEILERRNCYGN